MQIKDNKSSYSIMRSVPPNVLVVSTQLYCISQMLCYRNKGWHEKGLYSSTVYKDIEGAPKNALLENQIQVEIPFFVFGNNA